MWQGKEKAPALEFLGWTFLINSISYAISIIGERTGLLSGNGGAQINSVVSTLIGGFSPLYGTYIVLKRHGQISGAREFIRRVLHTENVRKTVIITACFCAALLLVTILAGERTGSPWLLFIPAIPLMVLGGGVEEIGWRGLLQPALEKRLPFIPAILTVTAIWFLWHAPLWLISSSNQSGYDLLPYALQLLVNAFALAAIYRATRSTIACILYHAWGNAVGAVYRWELFATFPVSKYLLAYDLIVISASIAVYLSAAARERQKLFPRRI